MPDKSPTNVTAYDTSSTSINITWQPIPSDHVNGILLDYNVIYRRIDKPKDNFSMVTVNSTVLHTELSGLGKYKQYSIQVAGRTGAGLGNFSEPVFVRTEQDGSFYFTLKYAILSKHFFTFLVSKSGVGTRRTTMPPINMIQVQNPEEIP